MLLLDPALQHCGQILLGLLRLAKHCQMGGQTLLGVVGKLGEFLNVLHQIGAELDGVNMLEAVILKKGKKKIKN